MCLLVFLKNWGVSNFDFWCVFRLVGSRKYFRQRLHIKEVFSTWLFMWVLLSHAGGGKSFHIICIYEVFLFSIFGSSLRCDFFCVLSVYRTACIYCRKINTQKDFFSVSCLMLFVSSLWDREKCISQHHLVLFSIEDVYFSTYFFNRGMCISLTCFLSLPCFASAFLGT